ncbi:radical SAM/SPASM domain-containing protein [uncultured Selenomonas sp.]|uniref:radical SAM/SPASM domain-containing protein n=1 Tax=uncultured Selenomonas sp. TaxID=159275 RepID=UPI0025FF7BD5|nr:radical SAM/SPASM domain-containing protein [uncultured Selenomonas sp.]
MYENVAEIEKNYKLSDFPLNLIIEVGNHCNLNCTTCLNDRLTRPRGFMNIFLYKKIVDEAAEVNPYTRLWLDFYGEPLLVRWKLYYMIDYAKKKGMKNLCINTNGTLIDREMAEMLLDAGLDFISIDCDGWSKEVYESIRVGADRDKFYANIEYLLDRKRERGMKKPIIELKAMEMEENKDEIPQILEYGRMHGAWTTTRRLISWGGQMEDIASKMERMDDRYACGDAVGICAITWDGLVAQCVMDVDAKNVFGDVKKESIASIWQRRNETFLKPQLAHDWDALPELCRNCHDWQIVGENRWDEEGHPMIRSYEAREAMQKLGGGWTLVRARNTRLNIRRYIVLASRK